MSTVQEQARALGDPTRHAIFRHIVETDGPVGVAELTEQFELNHNAIRQHLTKLAAADLVVEGRAPTSGRGRPRLAYTVDPAVESRWGATGPYERLSMLLAEVIHSGETPITIGRRAGRREVDLGADTDEPVDVVTKAMARNGFDPVVQQRGSKVDIVLQSCPFASTALAMPDVICALHHGIALGVAEEVGGIVVDELVAKDPRRAQCRLRLHRTD